MAYNTKNYGVQGADEWVVGGKLIIENGGEIVGLPKIQNQAASAASDVETLVTDFNNLLEKLKNSGFMQADAS